MIWFAADLPPDIPAQCIEHAAQNYAIPEELLVAILKVENGKVGKAYPRSHGTYFGPFQISDKWLPKLREWGYTAHLLTHDACANAAAGAYVLAHYYHRERDWVRAIGRYNVGSLNTPARVQAAQRYIDKVYGHWQTMYEKRRQYQSRVSTVGQHNTYVTEQAKRKPVEVLAYTIGTHH